MLEFIGFLATWTLNGLCGLSAVICLGMALLAVLRGIWDALPGGDSVRDTAL